MTLEGVEHSISHTGVCHTDTPKRGLKGVGYVAFTHALHLRPLFEVIIMINSLGIITCSPIVRGPVRKPQTDACPQTVGGTPTVEPLPHSLTFYVAMPAPSKHAEIPPRVCITISHTTLLAANTKLVIVQPLLQLSECELRSVICRVYRSTRGIGITIRDKLDKMKDHRPGPPHKVRLMQLWYRSHAGPRTENLLRWRGSGGLALGMCPPGIRLLMNSS